MAQIKGMAILGLFRIVKDLAGKDRVAELVAGRPEFTGSLGRSAAEMDVGSIFKIVSVILSAKRALQAAGMLWSRYCDTGRFVMTRIDDESGEGHIEDFPGISADHERLLTGWIEGIGLAAGARDPRVSLVASVHAGAAISGYQMACKNR